IIVGYLVTKLLVRPHNNNDITIEDKYKRKIWKRIIKTAKSDEINNCRYAVHHKDRIYMICVKNEITKGKLKFLRFCPSLTYHDAEGLVSYDQLIKNICIDADDKFVFAHR